MRQSTVFVLWIGTALVVFRVVKAKFCRIFKKIIDKITEKRETLDRDL